MEMSQIKKNSLGIVVQHTVDAKQSEPPGSEVQDNTSYSGVSELPINENNNIEIGEGIKGFSNKATLPFPGRKKRGRGWENFSLTCMADDRFYEAGLFYLK